MNKQQKDCNPTICNNNDLMSEWIFMTKWLIKECCTKCLKQEVCIRIIDLLNTKRYEQALDLIWYTHVP